MEHRKTPAHNLFASDLDGTLIPIGSDPAHPDAVLALCRRLAERDDLCTAFVTGRSPSDTLTAVAEHKLPLPDVLCCDVGTQILWRRDDDWQRDDRYHDLACAALGSATADLVHKAITAETSFSPQADEHQTSVKMSFRLAGDADSLPELEEARSLLSRHDWTLSLVASRCVYTKDLLLDVLPGGVDKATAVHHLRKSLHIETETVVYAGDSGNDLAPLTAGFRSIVVANAAPDLANRIVEFADREGWRDRIFRARKPHLHGVLEGASYFGVF